MTKSAGYLISNITLQMMLKELTISNKSKKPNLEEKNVWQRLRD